VRLNFKAPADQQLGHSRWIDNCRYALGCGLI
jgi:hypothetical protein